MSCRRRCGSCLSSCSSWRPPRSLVVSVQLCSRDRRATSGPPPNSGSATWRDARTRIAGARRAGQSATENRTAAAVRAALPDTRNLTYTFDRCRSTVRILRNSRCGDLLVAQPLGHEPHHLALAGAEILQPAPAAGRADGGAARRAPASASPVTAYSGHSPGTPVSTRVPRRSNSSPDPTTRSLTVPDGDHLARLRSRHHTRGQVDGDPHDVVGRPARTRRCARRRGPRARSAGPRRRGSPTRHRAARAGPSNVASTPSPVHFTSRPRKAPHLALDQPLDTGRAGPAIGGPRARPRRSVDPDDVGEQHGREHPVAGPRRPAAR